MKILSIGNSFSQDAQRYLHRLAKKAGAELTSANLYIGGCTLRTHYLNMLDDVAAYTYEFNGESTGLKVSIRQALVSNDWDVITLQQASPSSVKYETFTPYLEELAAYVRKYCPHSKLMIHQTWAYEADSDRLKTRMGFDTPAQMLSAVRAAYRQAADVIGADATIPAGEAMLRAVELGIGKIHRDTFHASLGAGRYLLALCWYRALTGADITGNDFDDFDAPVTEEERKIAIQAVNAVLF